MTVETILLVVALPGLVTLMARYLFGLRAALVVTSLVTAFDALGWACLFLDPGPKSDSGAAGGLFFFIALSLGAVGCLGAWVVLAFLASCPEVFFSATPPAEPETAATIVADPLQSSITDPDHTASADTAVGGFGIICRIDGHEQFIVSSVASGSPASQGGIKMGDILVKVNDLSLQGKTEEEVAVMLRGSVASKVVDITITQNGESREVRLTRTRRGKSASSQRRPPQSNGQKSPRRL